MGRGKKEDEVWPLWKERVVILYMSGMTQQQVADHMESLGHKLTRQAVSAIVRDPRAEELVEAAKAKFRETLITTIGEELDTASQLAVRAIKRTLEAEIHPIHQAKANQDRVAMKLLTGRGFLREDGHGEEAGYRIPPEQFGKLVKALEKSNRAKETQELMPAEVVDEQSDQSN